MTLKLPPYLRFDEVIYKFPEFKVPVSKKCQFVRPILTKIASTIKETKMNFSCFINDGKNDFINHSQLVTFIQREILPIRWHSYEFTVHFVSDKNSTSNFISSLLQLDQIMRCMNVTLNIYCLMRKPPVLLPMDEIMHWLDYESGVGECSNKKQVRQLQIYAASFQNTEKLCESLVKVVPKWKIK